MRQTLLASTMAIVWASQAMAGTDIIINAAGLKFSKDFSQIELETPLINAKQEVEKTKLKGMSVDTFVSFWDSNSKSGTFSRSEPNAILSSWDENNDYLETTFVIHSVEKTETGLRLNIEYLINDKVNVTPVSINNKPVEFSELAKYVEGDPSASVTVLVDSLCWLDGRCH